MIMRPRVHLNVISPNLNEPHNQDAQVHVNAAGVAPPIYGGLLSAGVHARQTLAMNQSLWSNEPFAVTE